MSNYTTTTKSSKSDDSIAYAKEEDEQPADLSNMILDGIIAEDYSQEYLDKLKLLEQRLQDKVTNDYFRCKVKHDKVYKQMAEIHNTDTSLHLL